MHLNSIKKKKSKNVIESVVVLKGVYLKESNKLIKVEYKKYWLLQRKSKLCLAYKLVLYIMLKPVYGIMNRSCVMVCTSRIKVM